MTLCFFFAEFPHQFEFFHDFFFRRRGQQADDDIHQSACDESGQEFIDAEGAAQRGNEIFPNEYHDAAGDHACQSAIFIGAFPEQGEHHHGTEGCAEACPREGHDGEYGAVGVTGQENGNDGNDTNGDTGNGHGCFFGDIHFKEATKQVLGHAGGRRQKLGVRCGHGGRKDTCQNDAGNECCHNALLAQEVRNAHDDGFGCGAFQKLDGTGFCHGIAYDTDGNGDGHGNDNPDGCHTAGQGKFFFILDGHEAQEDMGHAAVTQTPSHNGNDGQEAVRLRCAGGYAVCFGHVQITGHSLYVSDDGIPAAGYFHTEEQNDDQRDGHKDTLDQVCCAGCQKAAGGGVANDDNGGNDHSPNIVHAEQTAEEFAAGSEAGCCVRDEEHDNDDGGNAHEDVFVITVSAGEKVRDRDGVVCHMGVDTDSLGDDEPVEISTDGKTDGCPRRVCHTCQVSNAGQTHEEPTAHVGGFGTHGCDKGTQFSAAQIEVVYVVVFLGAIDADAQHGNEVNGDGDHDTYFC